MPEFPPSREDALVGFARTFKNVLAASAPAYSVTSGQVATISSLTDSFISAYEIATAPTTNSHTNIVAKNNAIDALVDGPGGIRALARQIQGTAGIPDSKIAALGLTVRDPEPSPIPVPAVAPTVIIERVVGRSVYVRLRDAENPDRRGKPDGVDGATILTYVGATAPADPREWTFEFNTSKTTFKIDFPATTAAGAQIWVSGFWFNPRKQASPPAVAQTTLLGAGIASLAA